ncbi:hypothetical protein [Streptomyces marincola]|uniref:hypothetical protein n=1 Tax=Streptomyces marincola TaxID=2878388 RepID=UPI00131D9205|nr:hypothetical protein [Streptomyces marincola]
MKRSPRLIITLAVSAVFALWLGWRLHGYDVPLPLVISATSGTFGGLVAAGSGLPTRP